MDNKDKMKTFDGDLEVDGRSSYQHKDPPGQRCVYIIPGNIQSEVYRISTFSKFPRHVPVDVMTLSKNGFYFTGYRDRVKCFSCAQCVEDWTAADDPASRDWHARDCQFLIGNGHGNVPIRIFHSNVTDNNTPATSSQQQPVNEPQQSNRTTRQTITNSIQTAQYSTNTNSEAELQRLFPCLRPRNPHMRNEYDRLQTFLDNRNWPSDSIRGMPQQFAEAGLFYLGNRDRVKCWYCNGGLQNWEPDDEPWFEHTKWYPTCEFLLQSKGPAFVETVTGQFPNLQRPSTSAPSFMNIDPTLNQENSESLNIIDPQKDIKELESKIDNDMLTSYLVEEARAMGFEDLHIRKALQKGYETSRLPFENFREMMEALLAINISEPSTPETEITLAETKPLEHPVSKAFQELRDLEKSRLCHICHDEPSSVLLLPCGHLVCCQNCSENVRKCPLCKRHVKERVRSYIS